MCTLIFDQSQFELEQDIELFQLFNKFCNKLSDEKVLYNSSKIRKIIADEDYSPLSTKTYDKNIKIVNKEFNYFLSGEEYYSNPAFQTTSSQPSNSHFHTQIFYRRLFFCLIQSQEPKNNENVIELQNNTNKTTNHLKPDQKLKISDPLHKYAFDIHKLNIPPFFVPLFTGIIGSIAKEKTSWKSFRENALYISKSFCRIEHSEINRFIPDTKNDLFKYWLEIYFSDELFDFIDKLENIIKSGHDRILSYNLNMLLHFFPPLTFLTRTGQKNFFQHMERILNLYMNTPMVDPDTLEHRNIDLFQEFTKAMLTIQNNEKLLIQ